jgi:hypothetical protein
MRMPHEIFDTFVALAVVPSKCLVYPLFHT